MTTEALAGEGVMPIRRITRELVDEIIAGYGHICKLNLSSNEIDRVEDQLQRLPSLCKLNLAVNRLSSRPGCLEGLLQLTHLVLAADERATVERVFPRGQFLSEAG